MLTIGGLQMNLLSLGKGTRVSNTCSGQYQRALVESGQFLVQEVPEKHLIDLILVTEIFVEHSRFPLFFMLVFSLLYQQRLEQGIEL